MREEYTLVLANERFAAEKLIKSGFVLSKLTNTLLLVLNICGETGKDNPITLEYIFKLAGEHGAELAVNYNQNSFDVIYDYLSSGKAVNIIIDEEDVKNLDIYSLAENFYSANFFIFKSNGELMRLHQSIAVR